ncbi:hypothetical protein QJS04_geneDACA011009 [Acorus gramineus]|uniref:Uncharacterized protein n=1 Tax=Acorus gramineus TaxID=55184 RepID=A0AAV9BDP1_ACOGR|nr:hypothetical protein QJS04_geneDACA011009 [Acorus gramineus]
MIEVELRIAEGSIEGLKLKDLLIVEVPTVEGSAEVLKVCRRSAECRRTAEVSKVCRVPRADCQECVECRPPKCQGSVD